MPSASEKGNKPPPKLKHGPSGNGQSGSPKIFKFQGPDKEALTSSIWKIQLAYHPRSPPVTRIRRV